MTKKILTVDDNKPIRMIIRRALKELDCEVVEAADGLEGLAVAMREKPDLIILDLTMPVMDGYETLTKLKASPTLKDIPVLMLTAEAGRDNVLRIAKLGVRGYIVKPFKDEAIVEKVLGILPLDRKGGAAPAGPAELSILVVEDRLPIVNQIKAAVADTTWRIDVAASAAEALASMQRARPAAVIVSLGLPDASAYTLFQSLRADKDTNGIPLLGLCLMSAAAEQQRARQLGVTVFVNKPIQPENLKTALERALNVDTTSKYFSEVADRLVLTLPPALSGPLGERIFASAQTKIPAAVENGVSSVVLDARPIAEPDVNLVQLVIACMDFGSMVGVTVSIRGAEKTREEFAKFEESKSWQVDYDQEPAMAA